MSASYFWIIFISLASLTLLIRVSFFYLYSYIKIPKRIKSSLSYIPMAILPALFTPAAFFHKGSMEIFYGHERFFAFILAAVVSYKTKSVFWTILSGLVILYLITNFI